MDNYGTAMLGSLVVEKLPMRPDWSVSDTGRLIFDLNTGTYWLGAPSNDLGSQGWIALGLTGGSIKYFNIDWDTYLTGGYGKVSAKHVPVAYADSSSNVQLAIDDISDKLTGLTTAAQLNRGSIKDYHLDFTGINKISASDIPIDNTAGYFSGTNIKIEGALEQLSSRVASDIGLDTAAGRFGKDLNFTSTTVQGALEDLEDYLKMFNASQLPCTYEGCGCDTNVQFAIDALYHLHTNLRLPDLIDVPNYDPNNRFLKSNGVDKVEWVTLIANDINAQYPGTTTSNVQAALWNIGISLDNLSDRIDNLHYTAEDIGYQLNTYTFSNVDDALDYVYTNFYNPRNAPSATQVDCSGIGTTTNNNVQLALTYLNTQVNSILSQMPCSVGAESVSYASAQGSTNVAHTLNYILGFINYAITNHGISYSNFTI